MTVWAHAERRGSGLPRDQGAQGRGGEGGRGEGAPAAASARAAWRVGAEVPAARGGAPKSKEIWSRRSGMPASARGNYRGPACCLSCLDRNEGRRSSWGGRAAPFHPAAAARLLFSKLLRPQRQSGPWMTYGVQSARCTGQGPAGVGRRAVSSARCCRSSSSRLRVAWFRVACTAPLRAACSAPRGEDSEHGPCEPRGECGEWSTISCAVRVRTAIARMDAARMLSSRSVFSARRRIGLR